MNLLKSLFITLYTMAAVALGVAAVDALLRTGDVLSWGGVLLTVFPFLVVLGRLLLLRDVARTSARFPVLLVLGAVGVTMALAGYLLGSAGLALSLAAGGFAAFLVYDFWYSSFYGRRSSALVVGNMLPAFELRNADGEWVSSTALLNRPTVWLFYRGNWCPLCMAQIKEVAAHYREVEALGARVALVSPQPQRHTARLAQRFDVPFEFLTDAGNRAAAALGIKHDNGLPAGMQALGYDSDTVLPTVVITDKGGRILWAHETTNYRVRPEPAAFIEILRGRAAELDRAA
jgi:peroxiredoxin